MLNTDFRDMLCLFNEEEVDYLVVGAWALGAHGLPRTTGDIDLWVRGTPENAVRVMRALRKFGAPLQDVTEADFDRPGPGLHIGVPPYRIDVLTSISGVTFEDAWENRVSSRIDEFPIQVPRLEDLLTNKRAANREKDRFDAKWIERELHKRKS